MAREVPDGWRSVELNQLALTRDGLQTGPFGSQLKASEYTESGIPVVMPSDIVNGKIDVKNIARVPVETANRLEVHKLVAGDIVFARRGDIGRCSIVRGDQVGYLCGTGCLRARLNQALINAEFADCLFKSAPVVEWLNEHAVGQTMLNLNTSIIAKIPLLLPPLHEQRRIAEILSSVDDAVAATRAVIEQIRKVKQGVLERLLTKGIGHTRFKQTEIGEIPEGWRLGTLGSIALQLEAGVSVNSENRPKQHGEIGILKTSCVSAGTFDPEEHKTVLPTEVARVKIPVKGDRIVISRMNTPNLVGANGYVEKDISDLFLPDRLWLLSTSENARWLAYLLACDQSREKLSAIATGTSGSMKNISKSKLLELRFAVPSRAEQQEIASIVQEIDASIEADSRILKAQIAMKSALVSDLLTGRKRVSGALPMAAE